MSRCRVFVRPQVGEGLRQWGRRVSQLDGDGGLVVGDVIECEADDAPDGVTGTGGTTGTAVRAKRLILVAWHA